MLSFSACHALQGKLPNDTLLLWAAALEALVMVAEERRLLFSFLSTEVAKR